MGFQAGVNFYQYVENNPVNFNDPSGLIIPQMIGGAVNALAGVGVELLKDKEKRNITWFGIGVDFATGAMGVGIAAKFSKLSKLAQVGTGAATGSGLFVAGEAAKNTFGIVSSGSDFNIKEVTKGITPGKIVTNGLPMPSFVSDFGKHAASGAMNSIEKVFAETVSQTYVNIAKGTTLNEVSGGIDDFIGFSATNSVPGDGSSGAGGGYVLYPSKSNINGLQGVYEK
uniref:RHS repeat-associated core domain-containing protein n=1 Tax=Candidatus Kentrum sp. LFY TaxID=2126342 RepID=A0A450WDU9_9GAMM|nr:MAG: hypothetical protein BECKLFY1418C_GA0070996_101349 [Candidatus Kentron sp. LFY]